MSKESDGLLQALSEWYKDFHSHPIDIAHRAWVTSVEARLDALIDGTVSKPSARPQSAWVPDARDSDASDFDVSMAMAAEIAELKSRVAAYEDQALRHKDDLAQRDEEIVRLKTANKLQAPNERASEERLAVSWIRTIVMIAANGFDSNSTARELVKHLRSCESGGIERIEFGVKEVLP